MTYRLDELHTMWGENAMVIITTTVDILKWYYKLTEENRYEAKAKIDAYRRKAMSGGYEDLIATTRNILYDECGIETRPYSPPTRVSDWRDDEVDMEEYDV